MTNKSYSEKRNSFEEKLKSAKTTGMKFTTVSGEKIEPFYGPDDIENINYLSEIGFPGEYPYTRGIHTNGYRGKIWTMRQFAGFGTPEDTNQRFHYLLNHGQTGLSVAFDLPTLMGWDADSELSEGEVGICGVAVSSLKDMEILFDEIPLDKVSTSMTINSTAAILLALYVAVAKKQGIDIGKISGTIQNDILKEYIARGTYIYPPEQSMRIITDIFKYCHSHLPHWNTISISGYHIREAGSTAVQEVAFTFANAIAYVEAAIKSGLNVDDFAGRLSFFFNSHNNLLEEIAKFRAARRMWANIMKNRFGAQNPDSMKLRFHTQTAGSSLTAQQALNNTVRTTIQALAAIAGGTQSLHTNSYDEALALPSEESVKIALRTQQIIAHESGISDTIDPFAGSYVIEYLTDEIEKRAYDYIEKIDKMGGAVEAVKMKYFQNEIARSSYNYQKEIEEQERIIVGVNRFQEDRETPIKILKIDEAIVRDQIASLKELRKKRNNEKVNNSLNSLQDAAKGNENLMPHILNCVEHYATIGEISNVLRTVFKEYND